MAAKVFLDYDQEALDRAFDQKVWAPDGAKNLEHYKALGEQARASLPCKLNLQYGNGPDEFLDMFPAGPAIAPVHIHIHGGGWRLLRKEDASHAAAAITRTGMHYVAPDFSALPGRRLPEVVDQSARAVAWVHQHAQELGVDPDRIFISGHSSGGHVCAVLLTLDWSKYGLPPDVIKGGLCISGMYDMEPVLLSARRSYVELDPQEARTLSPVAMHKAIHCPVSIAYAQNDSPEFIRQARQFADVLAAARQPCELIQVPDTNHYEIIGRLASLAQTCRAFAPGFANAERP